MAQRKPGFGHIRGYFNAAVAVHYFEAGRLQRLLPSGLQLLDRGPAPDGLHPLVCVYANGIDVQCQAVPLVSVGVDLLAVLVPGVRVEGARFRGSFAFPLGWWCGPKWHQRLGGRWLGLPPGPEPLRVGAGRVTWTAEVAGLVSMEVIDSGIQPDWPQVRALCPVLQQPLVTQRPDGKRLAAGLHWNLGDADMRNCTIRTSIAGRLLGGEAWHGEASGTSVPEQGGALRLGALWTMTRGADLQRDWGLWKSSPTLRLRADFALIDVDRAVRRPPSGATPRDGGGG